MKRNLIVAFAFSVLLAACSGGEAVETTTSDPVETTTSESTETTTDSETTTTSVNETTSTAPPQATGGSSCLEGVWELDDEAFFAQMSDLFAESEVEGELEPADGVLTVEMGSDGSMSATREDWGFSLISPDGSFNMRVNGTETGSWSADGSTLFLEIDPGATYEVETTFEAGGQVITLPQAPVDVPTDLFSTESEFTCDGDTFTVSAEGFTSILHRP